MRDVDGNAIPSWGNRVSVDSDTPSATRPSVEESVRSTIDHLLHGRVKPKTVADLDTAVARAKQNGAVGKIGLR